MLRSGQAITRVLKQALAQQPSPCRATTITVLPARGVSRGVVVRNQSSAAAAPSPAVHMYASHQTVACLIIIVIIVNYLLTDAKQ